MAGWRADTLVIIPARMASTRLPGKPLADISNIPMIVHVARRAAEANIGRVVVAVDHPETFAAVTAAGFEAVDTRMDHRSGSDRIYEALQKTAPGPEIQFVVNVQGGLPTIEPETIRAAFEPLIDPKVDIATLATEITRDEERANPNVVKVVGSPRSAARLRALYFTRATAPYGRWPALS